VDLVAETWRVLEDAHAQEPSDASMAPPAADAKRTQVRLALGVGILLAVAAAVWLVVAGPSGGEALVHKTDGAAAVLAQPTGLRGAAASLSPSLQPSEAPLVIEVNGAVRKPGLYRMAPGTRVGDAITRAGGYGATVDVSAAQALNLAAKLADGQQVHVPTRAERAMASPPRIAAGDPSGPAAAQAGPVDINTATAEQLDALPGVGPVTVGKIVAARAEQKFGSVDDLLQRKIVGQATLEKIRDLVTVH